MNKCNLYTYNIHLHTNVHMYTIPIFKAVRIPAGANKYIN